MTVIIYFLALASQIFILKSEQMTGPGESKIVTQEDVAKYAGVSRAVVSYVLNNGPRGVSEETRNRVLAAIQELGYRPNKHAQRLRLGDDLARITLPTRL